MKNWNYLQKGDVVDIVAPASHTSLHNVETGALWLKAHGLEARIRPDLVVGDVFFAAPLETQLQHLKEALYSESKAIWCIRGGYGSMRLIPYLKKLKPPKRPKAFIGFSDITALHLFFNQEWKWPTLHARHISAMKLDTPHPDQKSMEDMLFGKLKGPVTFKHLRPLNSYAEISQMVEGKIVGGNFRLLQSSLKTSWELKAKGKILFIEDVAERGYSLHRMFEQLIQAKLIDKGLKAVVLGQFTEGEEKNGSDLTGEAMKRFAESVPYPVLAGLPCGHGEINYPLPLNTQAELQLGKKAQLRVQTGGM